MTKNKIDRRVCYVYDAAGNLLCEMVRGAEGECLETRYQYDLKDRLTHQVTQGGAVTRYLYNQNDQLIKEIRPHGYEAGTDEGTETAPGGPPGRCGCPQNSAHGPRCPLPLTAPSLLPRTAAISATLSSS